MSFYGYQTALVFKAVDMHKKNQKLKKQREEEERRQIEEEEALQAEREIKQREIERLELKDLERRDNELEELRYLLEKNQIAVTELKRDAEENVQWERYLRCDVQPDPEDQRKVNSFITFWRDDTELKTTEVLKQCHIAVRLVEEIEDLLKKATSPQKIQTYQESLRSLQELIYFKHNLTSEEILKSANKNIDIKTRNFQTVIKDENITMCLWANLCKNPSLKLFNFEEVGLGFKLSKPLAKSNIAVRVIHTRYDHLSMISRITHPRAHTTSRRSSVSSDQILRDSSVQKGEDDDGIPEQKSKKVLSIQEEGKTKDPNPGGRGSQIFTQMEALKAESQVIPQPITRHASPVVDLMEYTPLGGVFYYEMFHLPHQAYTVGQYVMQQISDKGLQVFLHPTETSSFRDNEDSTCPPVGASVTLPDRVVFFEPPHVARLDATCEQWRMDGISDIAYEEAEAKLSFSMETFQPFVLMQKTYLNLPFQSWELRPLGRSSALFTIEGALFNLSITIQGNQCMLQLEQERGLSHLVGKWMSTPALKKAMLDAGVNIFVDEYTENYVSSCNKVGIIYLMDPLAEHAAYNQMALFASACAFSRSKWNAKCGAEHVVLQVCEHHDPSPVPKSSWSLYLLGAQRSKKLEMTEDSEAFSSEHHPNSEFHSTFIHLLQDSLSPDGLDRTKTSYCMFIDTIQSLLHSTRPLVYSETI
ncbi:dynein axonemal intermediate chain 7 isoform X2 [Nothobranchius furzeri]|uniref:dynein axonemal intermediate chain 7 isoform X2 n=1 Tax=Nothobranchius furzeri TaxID=105023 RepID=UPI003904DE16